LEAELYGGRQRRVGFGGDWDGDEERSAFAFIRTKDCMRNYLKVHPD
jgi:hypothetical protein